jgi:hypothetical protein
LLKPGDFYAPSHSRIFAAMIALFERGSEINASLIAEELGQKHSLDSSGGVAFLTRLTAGKLPVTSILHLAKVVRSKSLLRQLVTIANKITADALEEEGEPQNILDHAQQAILELAQNHSRRRFQHIKYPGARILEMVDVVESQHDDAQHNLAMLNAQRFLLEALYLEAAGTSPEGLERMRSYIFKRLSDPYVLPDHHPAASEESLEIRPKTSEIIDGFFRKIYPPDEADDRLKG